MSRSTVVLGRAGGPRRVVAAVGLPVLILFLAACGAGLDSQTYQERSLADGTNAAAGAIAVRNVGVQAPDEESGYEAGDDASVTITLANDGVEDDRLVEASSPVAASVEIEAEGEGVEAVPLPGLGSTGGDVGLVLLDLQRDLRPSEYVEVTLRFERSGSVTLQVPVATLPEREPREQSENYTGDEQE